MHTCVMYSIKRFFGVALGALLVVFASGCASTHPYNARDPLQGYNRAMFDFNDRVDTYVVKPLAEGYRFVVPRLARTGVSNFFANLDDILIGANNILQGKVGAGLGDWMRFAINSTFGLGGLLDVASEAQLVKNNEDFGQTLGWWGVGSGPYLVLPFLGSSTVRDGAVLPIGFYLGGLQRAGLATLINQNNNTGILSAAWLINFTDTRANLLDAGDLLSQAALDRYSFTRDAYLQRRRNLVYDGNPPKQKEDDDDARFIGPPMRGEAAPGAVVIATPGWRVNEGHVVPPLPAADGQEIKESR